ncbi:hypothetical protein BN946_scf184788.g23 [Trametes cinnabarina]|uniref:Uncharacterized protein n=1 Tax=Pycnoporus cinnabarinus TaxID=5643 RepID=A0A060S154_PYCCI|nr:hypothetical protein BN946_scf184788.g23 [Trametes cinnabarina]
MGFRITARQPPLTETEARTLLRMLRRMTHLEDLTLEDPDGLLMLIPSPELAATPLLLPKLKRLKYCMSFSIDFCHAFLSGLQQSPLKTIIIRYPKGYDQESDDESSDPFALLSKPCAIATLETLEIENLRYEYFDYSATVRFPLLGTLSLEFALDSVSPRMPIVGYLLSRIPNLTNLDIATMAPPLPWSRHQQPPIRNIRAANVQAQLNASHSWRLDRVSATVLDLWLLGLRFPAYVVDIRQVDRFTVEQVGNLVHDLFAETSPRTLYVSYRETLLSPIQAVIHFLSNLRAYWIASPHSSVPKIIELDLTLGRTNGLGALLTTSLALIYESIRLESFTLHIHYECKKRHNDPLLAMGFQILATNATLSEDESDDSEDDPPERRNFTKCGEAQTVFAQVPAYLQGIESTISAASQRGLKIKVKVTSYCDPRGAVVLSRGNTSQERVRRWLRST